MVDKACRNLSCFCVCQRKKVKKSDKQLYLQSEQRFYSGNKDVSAGFGENYSKNGAKLQRIFQITPPRKC